jgi:hypothetical protein
MLDSRTVDGPDVSVQLTSILGLQDLASFYISHHMFNVTAIFRRLDGRLG